MFIVIERVGIDNFDFILFTVTLKIHPGVLEIKTN